jgi:hypothetical protein
LALQVQLADPLLVESLAVPEDPAKMGFAELETWPEQVLPVALQLTLAPFVQIFCGLQLPDAEIVPKEQLMLPVPA